MHSCKKSSVVLEQTDSNRDCEESLLLYSPLLGCLQEHCGQVSLLYSMKRMWTNEKIFRRVEKGWITDLI